MFCWRQRCNLHRLIGSGQTLPPSGNIVQTAWFSQLAEAFQTHALDGFDFMSGPHLDKPATARSNSLSRLVFTTPTAHMHGLGMEIKQHERRLIDTDDHRAVELLEPLAPEGAAGPSGLATRCLPAAALRTA